jgi:ribose-phosphate pyrophosphokinase
VTPVALIGFEDEAAPAGRLADALGAECEIVRVHHFPDGESLPRVPAPAAETTVIYRSLDRPNSKLVELLLAADACRRAGARRLILAAPYFCYLRQDAVFEPGEPLSRDVIGPLVGACFDAVVTVQAHLHRTADLAAALGTQAINLWPIEALADALPSYAAPPLVVAPDAEAGPWARAWAERLGGEATGLTKVREGDFDISLDEPAARFDGRAVVIVDDVASSGRTLEQAALLARRHGARSIDVAVVHAMMGPAALERLREAGVREIVSADSVPHPTNAAALAPLLAIAIRGIIEAP